MPIAPCGRSSLWYLRQPSNFSPASASVKTRCAFTPSGSRPPDRCTSREPVRACGQASGLSADDVLQHLAVRRRVRHDLLQPAVPVLDLLQPLHPGRRQAGIPLLPVEAGGLADPGLAADLGNRRAFFAVLDDERLLRVRTFRCRHVSPLPSQPGNRSGKLQRDPVRLPGIRPTAKAGISRDVSRPLVGRAPRARRSDRGHGDFMGGQVRKTSERCAGGSQIAVPSRQRRADFSWRTSGAAGGPAIARHLRCVSRKYACWIVCLVLKSAISFSDEYGIGATNAGFEKRPFHSDE